MDRVTPCALCHELEFVEDLVRESPQPRLVLAFPSAAA